FLIVTLGSPTVTIPAIRNPVPMIGSPIITVESPTVTSPAIRSPVVKIGSPIITVDSPTVTSPDIRSPVVKIGSPIVTVDDDADKRHRYPWEEWFISYRSEPTPHKGFEGVYLGLPDVARPGPVTIRNL